MKTLARKKQNSSTMYSTRNTRKDREVILFALIIAAITALQYGYLIMSKPLLFGNDGYFHIRFSEQMLKKGIIHKFPQIYFSELRDNFYDKHLLYHLYQIPFVMFVKFFNIPLLYAAKYSATLLCVLIFVVFYLILISLNKPKLNAKEAFLLTLFFSFASSIFAFRIIMPRAISFGIVLFLVALYFVIKKDWKKTFVSCYVFALGYFAFPIAVIAAVIMLATEFLSFRREYTKNIKENRATAKAVFLGAILGLIINPFFPTNIFQGINTDLKASIFRAAELGNAEWSAITTDFFVSGTLACVLLLGIVIFYAIWKNSKINATEFSLLSLSFFLLLLSMKAVRILDFFVPVAIIFSAIFIAKENLFKKRLFRLLFVLIFAVAIAQYLTFASTILAEKQQDFSECAHYISENYPQQIIFNSTYDDFPQLYYYLPNYKFIVGLDEYYLFNYSRRLFDKYREFSAKPSKTLLKDFNARIIFVDLTQKKELANTLRKSSEFKEKFSAKDCAVFIAD